MSATMAPPSAPGVIPPPDDTGEADNVLVTICGTPGGPYTIFAGDEPEEDEGDQSEEDVAAMGPAGDQPAPAGKPADSDGAALKIVMDILREAASGAGGESSAQDQFQSGFNGSGGAAPAPVQKY